MKRRKHWYFIAIEECCLCGRQRIFRTRRYGRKPSAKKRYSFTQDVACNCHFFE